MAPNSVVYEETTDDFRDYLREKPISLADKRARLDQFLEDSTIGSPINQRARLLSTDAYAATTESIFSSFRLLWAHELYQVEALFGNVTRSYFGFHRWLFFNNVATAILGICFIVIPDVIGDKSQYGTMDSTAYSCYEGANNPYYNATSNSTSTPTFLDYVSSIFTGTGVLTNTPLFYGYYKDIESYNLPLAYILLPMILIVINVWLFAVEISKSIKHKVETRSSNKSRSFRQDMPYFSSAFTDFDYSIHEKQRVALDQSKRKITLETMLNEEIYHRRQEEQSAWCVYTTRFLMWFVWLGIAVGGAAGIFVVTVYSLEKSDDLKSGDGSPIKLLVVQYLPSLAISLVDVLTPVIFKLIMNSNLEKYSQESSQNVALFRMVSLRYISVLSLFLSLWIQYNCNMLDFKFSNPTDVDEQCGWCDGFPCWETLVGQEMYKLAFSLIAFALLKILFIEYLLKLYTNYFDALSGWILENLLVFSLVDEVLVVVELQLVTWIGMLFCPLLPVITSVALLVLFYAKFFSLKANMSMQKVVYKYCKNGRFFFVVLSVGFIFATIIIIYAIGFQQPSHYCGPMQFYEIASCANFTEFDTMWGLTVSSNLYCQRENSSTSIVGIISTILWYLGQWYIALILTVILVLALILLQKSGSLEKSKAKVLRHELVRRERLKME